jgi:hypothetical protein
MRMPTTGRMIKGAPKTKSKANGLFPLFSPLYSLLDSFVVHHLMSQGFWDVGISGRVGYNGGVRVCRTSSILSQYLGIADPERVNRGLWSVAHRSTSLKACG